MPRDGQARRSVRRAPRKRGDDGTAICSLEGGCFCEGPLGPREYGLAVLHCGQVGRQARLRPLAAGTQVTDRPRAQRTAPGQQSVEATAEYRPCRSGILAPATGARPRSGKYGSLRQGCGLTPRSRGDPPRQATLGRQPGRKLIVGCRPKASCLGGRLSSNVRRRKNSPVRLHCRKYAEPALFNRTTVSAAHSQKCQLKSFTRGGRLRPGKGRGRPAVDTSRSSVTLREMPSQAVWQLFRSAGPPPPVLGHRAHHGTMSAGRKKDR
jgi:hypothetical protein